MVSRWDNSCLRMYRCFVCGIVFRRMFVVYVAVTVYLALALLARGAENIGCRLYQGDGSQSRDFRDGEMFTLPWSPCQHFRCTYGHVEQIGRGCYHQGLCRAVGSAFLGTDCNTYTCLTSHRADGAPRISQVKSGCRDYHNVCRQPGDIFAYVADSILYNECTCHYTGSQAHVQC